MFEYISVFLNAGGSHGGGSAVDSLPVPDWDWSFSLEQFREAGATAMYYLSMATVWILSNPWTATILGMSLIAAALVLIRVARDSVE